MSQPGALSRAQSADLMGSLKACGGENMCNAFQLWLLGKPVLMYVPA